MHPNEVIASDIGKIVACARKIKGYSQIELGKISGITQASISRAENGSKTLSILEWLRVANVLELDYETVLYGSIDKLSFTELAKSTPDGFTIPRRYSENNCIKVRALLPFIRYCQNLTGEREFINLVESLDINELFLLCLDNQLNLNFVHDLILRVFKGAIPSPEELNQICSYSLHSNCHGLLGDMYSPIESMIDKISNFLKETPRYHCLYEQKLEIRKDGRLIVVSTLNPNISKIAESFDKPFLDCIENLFQTCIKYIPCSREARTPVSLTKQKSVFSGEGIYQVSLG